MLQALFKVFTQFCRLLHFSFMRYDWHVHAFFKCNALSGYIHIDAIAFFFTACGQILRHTVVLLKRVYRAILKTGGAYVWSIRAVQQQRRIL